MGLKVGLFEDDKDVADLIKEMLETLDFEVVTIYNLNEVTWHHCDIVLGDYRNKLVAFNTLKSECTKRNIPLIAISGADTDYFPQLLKPFSVENLQDLILETIEIHKKYSQNYQKIAS